MYETRGKRRYLRLVKGMIMDNLFVGLALLATLCCFAISFGQAIQASRSDLVREPNRIFHNHAHGRSTNAK